MKHYCATVLSIILALAFSSCQNDNETLEAAPQENGYSDFNLKIEGLLCDGGSISKVGFYCLPKHISFYGKKHWWEYYSEVKTVSSYDDFNMTILLHNDAWRYQSEDKDETIYLGSLETQYYNNKSAFILEAYNKRLESTHAAWPALFTAYTNGEVSITCDKSLYGEEPGTNLCKYFRIKSENECLPVGIENPKLLYDYGDEIPTNMAEYFVEGAWLQPEYFLEFADEPANRYDELTLTLTMPMTIEHVYESIVAKYKGKEFDSKFTDNTFKVECKILFAWDQ